jgi:hypothetical protein
VVGDSDTGIPGGTKVLGKGKPGAAMLVGTGRVVDVAVACVVVVT